jgi:hypothetical protein
MVCQRHGFCHQTTRMLVITCDGWAVARSRHPHGLVRPRPIIKMSFTISGPRNHGGLARPRRRTLRGLRGPGQTEVISVYGDWRKAPEQVYPFYGAEIFPTRLDARTTSSHCNARSQGNPADATWASVPCFAPSVLIRVYVAFDRGSAVCALYGKRGSVDDAVGYFFLGVSMRPSRGRCHPSLSRNAGEPAARQRSAMCGRCRS